MTAQENQWSTHDAIQQILSFERIIKFSDRQRYILETAVWGRATSAGELKAEHSLRSSAYSATYPALYLHRLRRLGFSRPTLLKIFRTFYISSLSYCLPVWGSPPSRPLSVLKNGIRSVHGLPLGSPASHLRAHPIMSADRMHCCCGASRSHDARDEI